MSAEPQKIWVATFYDLPPGAVIGVSAPDIETAAYGLVEASFVETQERERKAKLEAELFWLNDRSSERFP
jgi:hypothetical protein